MINGDGMPVAVSPLAVENELLKGTGSVMADGVSIFVEHLNVSENQFVVARSPEKEEPPTLTRFPSNRFDEAYQLFLEWKK